MLLPAWMVDPSAEQFKLQTQAHVSLEALDELQNLITDYHNPSTQESGGKNEQKNPGKASNQLSARAVCRSRHSKTRIASRSKNKSGRATKTVANRRLQTKAKRRAK